MFTEIHLHYASKMNRSEPDQEIDPDLNFLDNINIHCNYYTEKQFNWHNESGISIIHFNSRSLYANFSKG